MILRPYQEKAIIDTAKAIASGIKRALIVAPTGCHDGADEILLANGRIKRAKDIQVGDVLIGDDGTTRTVLETHNGLSNMYRIIPDKFDSYVVSQDHLLCLYRTPEVAGKEPQYEILRAADWNDKAKWFKHIRYLYRPGIELDFGGTFVPRVSPYVLGCAICDACQKSLVFVKPYKEWLSILDNEAKKFNCDFRYEWIEEKRAYEMHIIRKIGTAKENHFKEALRDDLKNEVRRIHYELRRAHRDVRMELLAGLLDGDGSYSDEKFSYEITFKQKALINDVRFIALSLGFHVSQIQTKMVKLETWTEAKPYYRLHISGDVWRIPCRIKKAKLHRANKNLMLSKFDVEFIGLGRYYGWSVNKNHRYLIGDMQVTHNSGKSILIGGICDRATQKKAGTRILVLCSSSHILEQNEEKIKAIAPSLKTGIYCAGIGRKETSADVILASRDSLGRNPSLCGTFEGIIVDEAHQVALDVEKSETMYARIINAQSPKWVIGMTGTPWRLSGGKIWGEGKFFEKITANIAMDVLRDEGFLVPYIFPKIESKIDTSNVAKSSTGDFQIQQLDAVSSAEGTIRACVEEWRRYVGDRKVSLFFCVTRAHAIKTAKIIKELCGVECGYIDGEVTGKERKGLLDEIREGKFRAVASVGVLTTGFDAPIVDCVVLLRPTLSASLFVQMCGRSLRPYPGKTNSLILDMAGNFDRFSCLETPLVKSSDFKEEKKAEKTEDAGTDPEVDYFLCHVCGTRLRKGARFCKYCLEIFKAVKEETWTGEEKWYGVFAIKPEDYFTAKGEKCKRVTYYINSGAVNVSEYFMIGRGGWHQRVWKKRLEQLFAGRIRAIKGKIEGRLIRVSDVEYYENQPHDLQSQPTTTGEIFV